MTDVKAEIISILRQSLAEFTKEEINFLVEEPENENFGDYFSNAALAFWANKESRIKNQKWKSPLELAQKIVNSIIHDSKFMIHFDRVEAVKPGFINFYLSQEYLIAQLSLVSGKTLLRYVHETERSFAGRRIMVEFTDPNPFKEFHIGHLYSNTVGESVSRLLEAMGANVKRANYQGDVGMHIAKSLYAIFQISNLKSQISNLEKKSAKERAEFLGQCYATGAKDYEDSEKAKREIEQLNKKIYDKDPDLMPLYEKGRQWSLEYFETIYKRLGTKFDFYYFESIVGINGLKLVQEYLQKGPPASLDAKHLRAGVFEKSQGAVIFPGKKFGLHDRVFINSLGLPTYEAKDLGLAFKKYNDFKFDQSISVTGNEIIEYFKVILAALKQIDPELAAKIKHLPHGMVRIPTGKMSSRSGNIVTGEWLLDEAKKLLKSKFSEMMEEVLEQVAVGAIKYALLKSSLGHDIEFNFEESINIQGNSGPYLQYTFARTQSVLRKTANNQQLTTNKKLEVSSQKLEVEELILLRTLNKFPEVVETATANFAPNLVCNYLFDLAQKFNLFYQKHKIIGSEQEDFRLALTAGVGQVIKTGLNLLGIEAPEKM